jgi:hypothetical protein
LTFSSTQAASCLLFLIINNTKKKGYLLVFSEEFWDENLQRFYNLLQISLTKPQFKPNILKPWYGSKAFSCRNPHLSILRVLLTAWKKSTLASSWEKVLLAISFFIDASRILSKIIPSFTLCIPAQGHEWPERYQGRRTEKIKDIAVSIAITSIITTNGIFITSLHVMKNN